MPSPQTLSAGRLCRSRTVTLSPWRPRIVAAVSPAGPPPMITISEFVLILAWNHSYRFRSRVEGREHVFDP